MTDCTNDDDQNLTLWERGERAFHDVPEDTADPTLAGIHAAMRVAYDAGRQDAAESLHLLPGSSVWWMVLGKERPQPDAAALLGSELAAWVEAAEEGR